MVHMSLTENEALITGIGTATIVATCAYCFLASPHSKVSNIEHDGKAEIDSSEQEKSTNFNAFLNRNLR